MLWEIIDTLYQAIVSDGPFYSQEVAREHCRHLNGAKGHRYIARGYYTQTLGV